MKAVKANFAPARSGVVLTLGLALSVFACGVPAWPQNSNPSPAAGQAKVSGSSSTDGTATLRVIVPWTHFKSSAAPAPAAANVQPAADPPPQPQTSDPEIVSPALSTTDVPSTGGAVPQGAEPATPNKGVFTNSGATNPPEQPAQTSPNDQNSQNSQSIQPGLQPVPVLSDSQSQPLYEEDISKKHPHSPEPVKLPPADQIVAPLSDSEEPAPPAETQNSSQSKTEASGAKPSQPGALGADNTPEIQIAALTAGYENRRQEREAKLKGLEVSAANGPSSQQNLELQETRLALEGEQDRMQTGQQLSKQFAILAGKIDARASEVNKIVEDRRQTALSAQAGVDQMKDLLPRRELALRNLAALPPSDDNNQMIEGLKTELSQDEATQKLDEERGQEAGREIQALESEAAELSQAAAKARQRSATYAAIAQNAQANQDRLADRMEYDLAQKRAAGMLAGVSKVIDPAPVLPGVASPAASPAAPASGGVSVGASPASHTEVESLRECLRKTGNVDACLAQQGGS